MIVLVQRSARLSHGFSFQVELVGVVDKPVEDGIGQSRIVETVTEHLPPDWQAARWWIERRFPGQWPPRKAIEHSGEIGPVPSKIAIVFAGPPDVPEDDEDVREDMESAA